MEPAPDTTDGEAADRSLSDRKAEVRLRVREWRDALSPEARQRGSQAIQDHLGDMPLIRDCHALAGYRAHGSEVNIDDLLQALILSGKRVYTPRTTPGRVLELCAVRNLQDDFLPGAYGILEPTGPATPAPRTIPVILVPGMAFDRAGRRVGFGVGYYDRLLKTLERGVIRIGVAFDCQVVPAVPAAHWDESMDWLVTESGLIRCPPT